MRRFTITAPPAPNATPAASSTPPSRRIMRCTRAASAPRLMRIPISLVRALTEKARTPAIPTAAMITASIPKAETRIALRRRGATLSSLICETVRTCSMGSWGTTSRTTRVAAPASACALPLARITSPPA